MRVDPFLVLVTLTLKINMVAAVLESPLAAMSAQVAEIPDPDLRRDAAAAVSGALLDLFDSLHHVQRQIQRAVDSLEIHIPEDAPAASHEELN